MMARSPIALPSVDFKIGKERLPAESEIEGQTRTDLKVVIGVERKAPLAQPASGMTAPAAKRCRTC